MISGNVLVLNRSFQPVQVTTVRRGLGLLYQGVAKAVDSEYRLYAFEDWAELGAADGESVGTVNRAIRVPRVLLLTAYNHIPVGRVRFSRLNVYVRDRDTCQYCGRQLPRSSLNLDHVVPRAHGGRTSWENVVCSCVPCNLHKGARTPEQAGMKLLRAPVRPRWTPFLKGPVVKSTYREWLPFLSVAELAYWNVELDEVG